MGERIYWHGNAAKTWVLQRLLDDGARSVIDHGCGAGGHWPDVLADHPGISYLGWDPNRRSAAKARRRGLNVSTEFPFVRVDAVVSFSVLEHVRDRARYMAEARAVLSDEGRFYLNYDDGHFRTRFDPDLSMRDNVESAKALIHNRLARFMGSGYQRRVTPGEAYHLARRVGLEIVESRYHNLEAFKWLSRYCDGDEFMAMWADVEERLNAEVDVRDERLRGDDSVLWQVMASKTLVLRPI